MRRAIGIIFVAVLLLVAIPIGRASAADSAASCNGILVSSLAGQAGVVGALTRDFHDAFKAQGIPPGFFDKASAQEHAGSVEECL